MLTPCFAVTQNDEFIVITMRVPYAKTAEAEFCIDRTFFKFYCKPYFLRLSLPGEIVEDGREKAVYDIDKGTVTVYVPKLHAGQYFPDLGMITSLLSKKPATKVDQQPLIEVLPGSASEVGGEDEEEEEEEFDWQIDQNVPQEDEPDLQLGKIYYGFADKYCGVFSKLQNEIPALVDCPDPEKMTTHERRVARLAQEETSFDPHHYLADLMEGSQMIQSLCKFQPDWAKMVSLWNQKSKAMPTETSGKKQREPDESLIPFTDEEKMQLKDLPNKEYLLDKATKKMLYLGLVDIVFAYSYDYRITEGEHNVESAWTICKLSSTLSWLENSKYKLNILNQFDSSLASGLVSSRIVELYHWVFRGSVQEVVYCSTRRCLCYPLYRHWELILTVLRDTAQLFSLGRRKLLQCLLDVRRVLNSSEPYYILNNLYIIDYCIWLQSASAKHIQKIATELEQVKLEKSSMGWELDELEEAAHLVNGTSSDEEEVSEEVSSSEEDSTSSNADCSDNSETIESNTNRQPTTASVIDPLNKIVAECGNVLSELTTSHTSDTIAFESAATSETATSNTPKITQYADPEDEDSQTQSLSSCATISCTHSAGQEDDGGGGVDMLTEGLRKLLTIQNSPSLPSNAHDKKIIEELN